MVVKTPGDIFRVLLIGLQRYFLVFVAILSVGVFGWFVYQRYLLVYSWSHDLGGVEPNVVLGIQRLLAGLPLYTAPEQSPYAIMMYSPGYYHLCALIGEMFGVDPYQPIEVFRLSRWVSLVFNLGFVLTFGILLRRFLAIPKLWVLILGCYLFVLLRVTDFSRPDSLYHFLLLVFFGAGIRFIKRPDWPRLLLVSLFAGLAIFAKQSAIILPVILWIWLFLQARWRDLGLSILSVAVFLALGIMASAQGDLGALWLNIYKGIQNGVSWEWFRDRILFFYTREISLLAAVGLFLAIWFLIKRPDHGEAFLGLGSLGLLSFGLLTALKWGSMPSYFTPFLSLTLMLLPFWLITHFPKKQKASGFFLALVVFLGLLTEVPHKLSAFRHQPDPMAYQQDAQVAREWGNMVSQDPEATIFMLLDGQNLLEKNWLNHFLFDRAILPTKDLYYQTRTSGAFSYAELRQGVNSGLVRWVVKYRNSQLVEFQDISFTRFEKVRTIGPYDLYRYRE